MSAPTRERHCPHLRLLRGIGSKDAPPAYGLLRPCHEVDRPVIEQDLTSTLLRSYPRADRWLSHRLEDVLEGSADAYLARDLRGLQAIAIETPKAHGKLKLSTIWVAERARRKGLGTRLLQECRNRWLERGLDEVWITVSPLAFSAVSPLLFAHDFRLTAVAKERYEKGRPEAIFTWRPENKIDGHGRLLSVVPDLSLAA
jgi:ribosomal protein S18 acetylase RimI-like enzyme